MRRTKTGRGAATALAAVASATGAAVITLSPSASAATDLGGLSVENYCQNTVGLGGDWHARLLDQRNAYSWKCFNAKKNQQSNVDMNYACSIQYARQVGAGAWAKPLDTRNAYSWHCFK